MGAVSDLAAELSASAGERRRFLRHSCMAGPPAAVDRTAALLDLENLLHPLRSAGPAAIEAGVHAVLDHLRPLGTAVSVTACCDDELAAEAYRVARVRDVRLFPGPRGKDRADRELERRLADVPPSVDTVVIGSGDGAFSSSARALRAAGFRVVVLGLPHRTSGALGRAADDVRPLRLPTPIHWPPLASATCRCDHRVVAA